MPVWYTKLSSYKWEKGIQNLTVPASELEKVHIPVHKWVDFEQQRSNLNVKRQTIVVESDKTGVRHEFVYSATHTVLGGGLQHDRTYDRIAFVPDGTQCPIRVLWVELDIPNEITKSRVENKLTKNILDLSNIRPKSKPLKEQP